MPTFYYKITPSTILCSSNRKIIQFTSSLFKLASITILNCYMSIEVATLYNSTGI